MKPLSKDARPEYGPLYFLAALGSGGLVVTFFLYLMFWVPHRGRPVPIFEDITAALASGAMLTQAMIYTAWGGIAVFAGLMVWMLFWNLREMAQFRQSDRFDAFQSSASSTQMMAIPLTLTMAINVSFILGLVFVPGLWPVIEYLFPLALIGFVLIGIWGLRLYGGFLSRALAQGGMDCAANNSFAQALPAFAFAMVSVGLAAPAAMSATPAIAGTSLILSTFFFILAAVIAAVSMILGLRAMLEHGISEEASPTLLVGIPLLTVLAITLMRQSHGLHVHFGAHGTPASMFQMLTPIVMAQIIFALFGMMVLRQQGYFGKYVTGPLKSAGSYALICPGVALSVILQFYVNKGLVGMGLVGKYSAAYWALSTPALLLQVATILLLVMLNLKHFQRSQTPHQPQTA